MFIFLCDVRKINIYTIYSFHNLCIPCVKPPRIDPTSNPATLLLPYVVVSAMGGVFWLAKKILKKVAKKAIPGVAVATLVVGGGMIVVGVATGNPAMIYAGAGVAF